MKNLHLFLLVFTPFISAAQYGVLDANFDANGILSIDIDGNTDIGLGVIQAADGKLLACGYTSDTGNDFFVKRVHPDGSSDNTFGTNGLARINFALNDEAYCMALQQDGKILLGGSSTGPNGNDFAVVRLLDNGTPDPSFGNSGLALVEIGTGSDVIYDIAIQADGKIVGAGITHDGLNVDVAVIRLNANGSLDNTFSFDGKVVTSVADDDLIRAVAVGQNGSITIVGYSQEALGDNVGILVRYNSDGSLDNSFGVNGVVTQDFGSGADELFDLVIDGSGKILACGRTGSGSASDMLLAKFNSDGSTDNTFSFDGQVKVDFEGDYDHAFAMVLQPDSRVLIAGSSEDGVDVAQSMARFNSDGSLDNTFGTNGKVATQIGTTGYIRDITLQSDLRIVTCGFALENNYNTTLARYTSGMNVGIGEIDAYIGATLVYPNPIIDNSLTIEYELNTDQTLSIELMDVNGKLITVFQSKAEKRAGMYSETYGLPDLVPGQYLLNLLTQQGAITVKLTVN